MAEEKQVKQQGQGKGMERGQQERKGPQTQQPAQAEKPREDIRYIVRIANKDLNGNLAIERALWGIRGINQRIAKIIAAKFEAETGIAFNEKIGKLPEEKDRVLEEIVLNPGKHGIPGWVLNRQNDRETGEMTHRVMGDLEFGLRKDIMRLGEIRSYRGLRHAWGLPVRGQRVRSTHRGKGGVVGVMKKEAQAAQEAAAKTAQAAKTGAGAAKGAAKPAAAQQKTGAKK